MDGYEIEYIPAEWVERACACPGLIVRSRPVVIERRTHDRRGNDRVENLLRSILETPNAS